MLWLFKLDMNKPLLFLLRFLIKIFAVDYFICNCKPVSMEFESFSCFCFPVFDRNFLHLYIQLI